MDHIARRVGIIGAGAIGQAIAGHLVRNGIHGVLCNSRDPATLDQVVRRLGPAMLAGTLQAAASPEIVILAVPWARVAEVLEAVPDWEGRILVDATNPDDGSPGSSSERVAALALGARLVRSMNTLPAHILTQEPRQGGGRRVIFASGDHARAKRQVMRLIEEIGFAAVDLGSLATGGRLQQVPGGGLAMLNLLRV